MPQFFIQPTNKYPVHWAGSGQTGYTLNLHGQQALERQEDGLQTFHCRTVVRNTSKKGEDAGQIEARQGEKIRCHHSHTLNGVIEWKAGVGKKSRVCGQPTKE